MPQSRVVAILLVALGIACVVPTGSCACTPPPPRTHGLVFGLVRAPGGGPRATAQVRLKVMSGLDCSMPEPWVEQTTWTRAGRDGRFRQRLFSHDHADEHCVRATAFAGEAGASDSSGTAGLILSFTYEGNPPDSVGVVLELP